VALNGQFPDTLLTYLGWPEADHLRLVPDAAASLNRLAIAFENHFDKPLYITDAYRTLATQIWLKASKGTFAARPGTSNHGWGLAIDMSSRINIDSSDEHRWMENNGPHFGWINPWWAVDRIRTNGEYEPWHWEFHADLDRSIDFKDTPTATIPEDDMSARAEGLIEEIWARLNGVTGVRPDSQLLNQQDGQTLRDDIAASTARAVAETSSAYHQLTATLGTTSTGAVNVTDLAAALSKTLSPVLIAELVKRLAS